MLTKRFAGAFALAEELHRAQRRKGAEIPYIAHPMAVAGLVLEYGGDEDEAIAGLLHDAVEDQGGLATARRISERFGPRVAQIVMGCTDAIDEPGKPKPAWRARKAAFVSKLGRAPTSVGLVVACDKIHNLTCLIADVAREGPATLARFARPSELSWYYTAVSEALGGVAPAEPAGRLRGLADVFKGQVAGLELPQGAADA